MYLSNNLRILLIKLNAKFIRSSLFLKVYKYLSVYLEHSNI